MPSKSLQHYHAIVALAFPDEDARRALVVMLDRMASVDAEAVENFTHSDGRPAAVIRMRYRARGANKNDTSKKLARVKAGGVDYDVLHDLTGFAVKRPELEQEVPRRAATEPTDPVQPDWRSAASVTGPDAPFQGALRVPLLGPVDKEWLAALKVVQTGTDVLEVEVEDATLYVPDPWHGESALTQAGEARQTLREGVTQFLNLVNDQYHFRTGPPSSQTEHSFETTVRAVLNYPMRRARSGTEGPPRTVADLDAPSLLVPYETEEGHRGHTSYFAGRSWRLRTPPATVEERDDEIELLIAEAAAEVRRLRPDRAALIFISWVGAERWVVAHAFERGQSATWQAPLPDGWDEDPEWQRVEDARGRFRELQAALDEEWRPFEPWEVKDGHWTPPEADEGDNRTWLVELKGALSDEWRHAFEGAEDWRLESVTFEGDTLRVTAPWGPGAAWEAHARVRRGVCAVLDRANLTEKRRQAGGRSNVGPLD